MLPIRNESSIYLTKLHQQQLREGQPYGELGALPIQLVFSIMCCIRERVAVALAFSVVRSSANQKFSSAISWNLHLVELPKFNRTVTELSTDCERWSYFLRHGDELDTEQLTDSRYKPLQFKKQWRYYAC